MKILVREIQSVRERDTERERERDQNMVLKREM